MRQMPHLSGVRGGVTLLGQQAVLDREQTGGDPARGADLRVDVLDVVARGLLWDPHFCLVLPARQATREQPKYVDFARGETGRIFPSSYFVPSGGEHRLDRI